MDETVLYRWAYYLTVVCGFIFLVVDLALAIRFNMTLKEKKEFPIPDIFRANFCYNCKKKTLKVIQIIVTWLIFVSMQLIPHHLAFIFLAFVASPVQTGSTFLLYVTSAFSGVIIIALILTVFQQPPDTQTPTEEIEVVVEEQQKTPAEEIKEVVVEEQQTSNEINQRYIFYACFNFIYFTCLLIFTIFFFVVFIRITIYVGDVQSGGIPDLFASLAPSVFLAGVGYVGKKMLDRKLFLSSLLLENFFIS